MHPPLHPYEQQQTEEAITNNGPQDSRTSLPARVESDTASSQRASLKASANLMRDHIEPVSQVSRNLIQYKIRENAQHIVDVQQPTTSREHASGEYPKKCEDKNERPSSEERWIEIGKAFDQYDVKMIESVKASIDSLLVFVCDLLLSIVHQIYSSFAGRSFLCSSYGVQYPCVRVPSRRSVRCDTHHPCSDLAAAI